MTVDTAVCAATHPNSLTCRPAILTDTHRPLDELPQDNPPSLEHLLTLPLSPRRFPVQKPSSHTNEKAFKPFRLRCQPSLVLKSKPSVYQWQRLRHHNQHLLSRVCQIRNTPKMRPVEPWHRPCLPLQTERLDRQRMPQPTWRPKS